MGQKADLVAPLTAHAQRQSDKRDTAEARAEGDKGLDRRGVIGMECPGAGYERDPFNPQQWRLKKRIVDGTEKVEVEFVTPRVHQSGRDQTGKYHGVPQWLRDESTDKDENDDDNEMLQEETSANPEVLQSAQDWYNAHGVPMEVDL